MVELPFSVRNTGNCEIEFEVLVVNDLEIEYDGTYEIKGRKFPFQVREFTPLQYTRLDLDHFVNKRVEFSGVQYGFKLTR